METLFILLQKILPQHLLSRATGWLADVEWLWLKNALIGMFISQYDVNMDEAVHSEPAAYKHFNEFFTRPLKDGVRPLADSQQFILSPADGAISQLGKIESGDIFQAKGQSYTAAQLLGGNAERAKPFENGEFITVYLSPRDYHRVHAAIGGELKASTYLPGELFSVNEATARNVPQLFARNERLVGLFDTDLGEVAVVMVGAMIVAGIETVWGGRMSADSSMPDTPVQLSAGDELGRFYLGSTVILLFEPGKIRWLEDMSAGAPLKMGQAIAELIDPK
ncbi:MAG: archaetidylserine decarboxylase [Pseudomonadales bacterium]